MSVSSELAFRPEDLALFCEASHDRNPLHLSNEYSYRTAFGQQVVYGVLGFLGALSRLKPRPGWTVCAVIVDFPAPLFLDVPHQVSWEERGERKARFRVSDGRRMLMKGSVEWREASDGSAKPTVLDGVPRLEAAVPDDAGIRSLTPAEGTYRCRPEALDALLARWSLQERGVSRWMAACLLWSSYAVGMELPGERALFSRLKLELGEGPAPDGDGLVWRVTPTSYDERFSILHQSAVLESPDGNRAQAAMQAFVRQGALPATDGALLPEGRALDGKTVLVMGGSRGLGAAFVRATARQGATVCFSYHRSPRQAAELLEGPGAAVVAWAGDAASLEWCTATAGLLERDYGGLDILVVNASPALNPLWLEAGCLDRIHDFLARSVAMMSTPLAAFLPALAQRGGCVVIVSSNVVNEPVADWPHYVMAKHAIEGLVQVAAMEYPGVRFLLVRPPRLLTDLTNTPLGRQGALSPQVVARAVTDWLNTGAPAPAGTVSILDSFAE